MADLYFPKTIRRNSSDGGFLKVKAVSEIFPGRQKQEAWRAEAATGE